MELSVQNVYGLLLRSRLLSADDAREMFERWQQQAGEGAGDLGAFARWMVANQYVTEYQATLLARGHADCFFLNQYKILDRLGKGRMAGVYKAVHRLGQLVAIKVLPPSKARDAQLLARFQREARLALRLKHPNVVRTFQVGEAGGLHYLVMECLEGETLDEVLQRRGKLPPSEAVRVVYQALLGLQHIHELGVVHRDLKPANLMIVPESPPPGVDTTMRSVVKILDMSLGRALSDEALSEQGEDAQLTTEGTLLGTPDYMAPEQARDAHGADIRADIYSLGCVLYHTIAGQSPFPDSNIISQMLRHATEAPRPLKEFNPAVPDGLQQIVSWMLAKDPAKRYPTPARAAQALQVFLASEAEPLSNPEADARMRSFLTWLEMGDAAAPAGAPSAAPTIKTPPPPPAPGKPAVPVAAPVGKPAAVASARAEPSPAEGKRRARKEKRQDRPVPAESPPGIDVELLPAPPPAGGLAGLARGLTRRDLLLFGLGGGSVLVAIFLGWVASRIVAWLAG